MNKNSAHEIAAFVLIELHAGLGDILASCLAGFDPCEQDDHSDLDDLEDLDDPSACDDSDASDESDESIECL